ncbi:MAG: YbaB/EbfC family nucleoid-associated protein [Acidobacteria bacterium]|uniref:Nucleoid-associated protein IFK94_05040 n=1 Tax=Candidatus Polarisedimenticola svalbardensis TaxID=2886004 RepID=A0A8J6Y5I4_9BACT|nr:YbaB/EbfC family nucleoid-associated protein [Candidatus Polarisedimenticola svalbardensis]
MNIAKMMKDLQKMQGQLQEQVDALEVEGTAGGGVVIARMNGKKELLGLKLTPDAVTPEDLELMEDLILAAINDAGKKVDHEVQGMTQGMAGGLNIPGLS